MIRTLAALCLAVVLLTPLSGCIPMLIGYAVAKAVEGPKIVTTTCTDKDPTTGQQTCTTTSR